MHKNPIQIVLADDNRFFCEALKDSLNQNDEFNVIYFSTNLKELIDFCNVTNFDILILDVNFNGTSSLDFISEIRKEENQFKIISLTTLNNDYIQRKAVLNGIDSFVGKDTDFSKFKDIIINCVKSSKEKSNIPKTKKIKVNNMIFTERKLEILQSLYNHSDKNEKDLSKILNISMASLKTHKRELFEITNTANANDLIKFGIKNGIIIS
jgi:DNA-binding NarL/FixJ family response regulator